MSAQVSQSVLLKRLHAMEVQDKAVLPSFERSPMQENIAADKTVAAQTFTTEPVKAPRFSVLGRPGDKIFSA